MSPSSDQGDDSASSITRNLAPEFVEMDPFRTPPNTDGPTPPHLPSTARTPKTPYDQTDVMHLIAALQQGVRELRAQAAHSRPVGSDVTMQTTSPAASSAAHLPFGAPRLKDFKVIEFNGEEQHPGLKAYWDSVKYDSTCRSPR